MQTIQMCPDLLNAPSRVRGMPYVEAMALGKPVIATNW